MARRDILDGPLTREFDRAESLASGGARSKGSWTLAQTCDHLARAIELTLPIDGPNGGRDQPLRVGPVLRWFVAILLLRLGWIPRNVPMPEGVAPDASADRESALQRLRDATTRFESEAARPDARWPTQVYLGRLTADQWRRFHHVHAAHHFVNFMGPNE